MFLKPKCIRANSGVSKIVDALALIGKDTTPLFVCISGASGCGKSFLGRFIRKGGLPGYPMRKVSVIDDGVMSRNLLGGLFRPKIRFPSVGKDELIPFQPYISSGVRVIFFVCSTPLERVSRCDLLIVLHCDDKTRRQRLISREGVKALERLQRECAAGVEVYPEAAMRLDLDSVDLF